MKRFSVSRRLRNTDRKNQRCFPNVSPTCSWFLRDNNVVMAPGFPCNVSGANWARTEHRKQFLSGGGGSQTAPMHLFWPGFENSLIWCSKQHLIQSARDTLDICERSVSVPSHLRTGHSSVRIRMNIGVTVLNKHVSMSVTVNAGSVGEIHKTVRD